MILAQPVFLPQRPEHILLKPGARLDHESIQRLLELNVRTLCIDYPPTAFLLRYVNPQIAQEQVRLASRVGDCIDAVASGLHAKFDFLSYLTSIRGLIRTLVETPEAALFVEDIVDAGQSLVGHSFNVGVLSLLMGLRLDGYLVANRRRVDIRRAQSVENLGLGGLMHDVGMLRIDESAALACTTGDDIEHEGWREHVLRGFELVRGRIPPTAAACVLHHHQRLDGSGFPSQRRPTGAFGGLAGREIHVFTRIVAVADVFNRFRRPPGQHGVVEPTVRALWRTLQMVRERKLDPVAFRALLSVVPAFAPGSVVQLNDGRNYVVTGWDPVNPCRPQVCAIAFDEVMFAKSEIPETSLIDLKSRGALRVVKADGQDVSADLFEPAFGGEFDLHAPYPFDLVQPTQAA